MKQKWCLFWMLFVFLHVCLSCLIEFRHVSPPQWKSSSQTNNEENQSDSACTFHTSRSVNKNNHMNKNNQTVRKNVRNVLAQKMFHIVLYIHIYSSPGILYTRTLQPRTNSWFTFRGFKVQRQRKDKLKTSGSREDTSDFLPPFLTLHLSSSVREVWGSLLDLWPLTHVRKTKWTHVKKKKRKKLLASLPAPKRFPLAKRIYIYNSIKNNANVLKSQSWTLRFLFFGQRLFEELPSKIIRGHVL